MKFCKKERKLAVVLVYKTGWDCDPHVDTYIRKLVEGIRSNSVVHQPEFFILTDYQEEEIFQQLNVNKLEFTTELVYWHKKFEIFKEETFKEFDQIFYFDLDIMITGNLDGIFSVETDFCILKDPLKGYNSSVMAFKPKFSFLLDEALKLDPDRTVGDQTLIEKFLKENNIQTDFWQDYFDIMSYKMDFIKNQYKIPGPIIFFHGLPRPHELLFDLNYRKPRQGNFVRVKPPTVDPPAPVGYARPEPIFTDKTVYIIGGGPSIKDIDFDNYLMDEAVLAINDAYKFSCSKVLFFGDQTWYNKHEDYLKLYNRPIWTTSGVRKPGVNIVRSIGVGLPQRNSIIGWSGNSGFAGISLALNMNAKKIVLFGYDMKLNAAGESNWHPNLSKIGEHTYKNYLNHEKKIKEDYDKFWSHVEIINANLDSKLSIFKKEDPIKILESLL